MLAKTNMHQARVDFMSFYLMNKASSVQSQTQLQWYLNQASHDLPNIMNIT